MNPTETRSPAQEQQAAAVAPTSPLTLPGLTVVLPCFNEELNVADAVRNAASAAAATSERYEVIVVDDGSVDGTAARAAEMAARDSRVRLVVHATNRGYGQALRSGLDAATMPWVLLTDADLQFDLRQLERFLPAAMSSDVIWGYRIHRQDPRVRRLNAAAWNWLVRHLLDVPVRDVDCAFKLVRRDVADRFDLQADGAMISTELLVKAVGSGARVAEVGVDHRPRVAGEQSGANPRVVLTAFRELARLRSSLAT